MKEINYRTNACFTSVNGTTVRYEDVYLGIKQAIEVAVCGGFLRYDMAEDVFQNAAVKASNSAENFDEGRASAKTFGSRIALSVMRDAVRKSKRFNNIFIDRKVTDDEGELLEPAPVASYRGDEFESDRDLRFNELMAELEARVAEFNDVDVIILSQTVDGRKPREIAKTLSITPNAVSVRLSKARKVLREEMSDTLREYGMAA